nr:MazG-like family protein [uncultured Cohaesibacter sp.]
MLKHIYDLTQSDGKSLQERSLKLSEEVGELAQAVLSATGAHGSAYKGLTMEDVREEAADAAIVALSLIAQTSDNEQTFVAEVERLINKKCEKWQAVLASTMPDGA